jgi:integrase
MESAHRTRLAMAQVGIVERPPAPTLEEFAPRFLKWVEVDRGNKPNTVLFYRTRIQLLQGFQSFKTARLNEIDEVMIAQFVEWRRGCKRVKVIHRSENLVEYANTDHGVSVCGINRELAILRRVLRVAKEWKLIPEVPAIHLLPGEKQSDRVLTQEEEEAYLQSAPPLLREYATVPLDTGMRPEEILRMRWEHVHFDPAGNATYGLHPQSVWEEPQGQAHLSITARVRSFLEPRHDNGGNQRWGWVFPGFDDPSAHTTYSTIKGRRNRTLGRLQGFTRFTLYDMRRTFLTRLGESGVDAFTIMKIAGHSTIAMSQRYVHPTPERVEDAFSRLEAYNLTTGEQGQETDRLSVRVCPYLRKCFLIKCRRVDSNHRPKDYETFALTSELRRQAQTFHSNRTASPFPTPAGNTRAPAVCRFARRVR